MKSNRKDYLKYWRVIRYFIKKKHDLNQADLDMLLFLYSEDRFNRAKFEEFDNLLGWDEARFERLIKQGWIEKFRHRTRTHSALYSVSYKCKRMIDMIYKYLEGKELPQHRTRNPLFGNNLTFSDKVYRNFIRDLYQSIRRQQRHAPE